MKDNVVVISWDEICGEASVATSETKAEERGDKEYTLHNDCTDDELVAFLRDFNGDDEDEDDFEWGQDWLGRTNKWGWRCAAVTRGKKQAVVEWRSDRNHLAVTTVIWY